MKQSVQTNKGPMKPAPVILLNLALAACGCAPSAELLDSGWSAPESGLQFQISSSPRFVRQARDLVRLEATCTLRNSGTNPVAFIPLARLYLVNEAGVTNACQRDEDKADKAFPRASLAPGQTNSWRQDGHIQIEAGSYQLFAIWDRDKGLKSPPRRITIK